MPWCHRVFRSFALFLCNQINPAIRHLIPRSARASVAAGCVSYLISCSISSYLFHSFPSAGIFLLQFSFCVPFSASRSMIASCPHLRRYGAFYLSIWVDDFNSSSNVDTSQTKQYWIYEATPAPNSPFYLLFDTNYFFSLHSWNRECVRARAAVCVAIFIRSSLSLFNSSRANFSFFTYHSFFSPFVVYRATGSCSRASVFACRSTRFVCDDP